LLRQRSRFETINLILTLALEEVQKTHILYRANLSHRQLIKYLDLLLDHRLLAQLNNRYVTTAQGHEFIIAFREIQAILDETQQVR
jgi:predicted transcriptional regulator